MLGRVLNKPLSTNTPLILTYFEISKCMINNNISKKQPPKDLPEKSAFENFAKFTGKAFFQSFKKLSKLFF